ncbi:MAG: S46 family peptidase [Candidatus Latescibacteria bacterium]|nr:S46 family peptidase [Candidatus Latescibacterota bacterium]NIM64448.1 S46 family peptidase [Candidatus Latescibacterota bacterium]NIO00601.1 S46 family peptidase [Candidatus Latescibacterota bacterium]NIO27002.1 S46 family peptidase [Candidatus Latescibacterota bacterium]NIO56079.1 S46 family peptidase [Candidatus Latescibacterota bacterium]
MRFLIDTKYPAHKFDTLRFTGGFFIAVFMVMVVAAVFPTALQADEGMWLLQSIKNCPIDAWQRRGLELDAKAIYDPKEPDIADAIIRLGGGSASFVSFDGLIITNHHVAFSALQRQSSAEINYMKEGFLAETMKDEIPAPGYEAFVTLDVEDVTKKVLGAVKDDMGDKERYDAIEKQIKKIVNRAEKGKDLHAEVRSFYGGLEYRLFTYFKIKDIRIVYAPPGSIGNYGGEVDNWMWPRHTGDFSFLRAYVGPDGKSAEYSEDNVPYHPRKYLSISKAPLEEDDFTMVIGYPGSTRRYRTSYSIDYYVNSYYPAAIKRYEDIIGILEDESEKSEDAKVKLAGMLRGLQNGYKNNKGMLTGLKKARLLEKKQKAEQALRRFLEANPDLEKKFGSVLEEIGARYEDYTKYWRRNRALGYMFYGPVMLSAAHTIYRWSAEQEKKDMDRDPGYMERDEERLRRQLKFTVDSRYYESADKRILKYLFLKAAEFPEDQRIAAVTKVCEGLTGDALEKKVDEFIDGLYSGTRVVDPEMRMKMFDMKKKELLAMNDPLIEFAAKLEKERKIMEEITEAFAGALQKLRPRLMELRKAYGGELVYPDANRTKRLSAGAVKGYSPGDAVHYDPITTLTGVIDKYTGEDPFDLPNKIIELYEAKDFGNYVDPAAGDIPVCFLSSNDVTGGNSGSPILNGRGEIIGLVFDGNYESISADYQFIPKLTRTINVDSRYILFTLEKYANADKLLDELTIH